MDSLGVVSNQMRQTPVAMRRDDPPPREAARARDDRPVDDAPPRDTRRGSLVNMLV